MASGTLTFEQLKSAYTHENIVKDLGKLGAEDPFNQFKGIGGKTIMFIYQGNFEHHLGTEFWLFFAMIIIV